MQQPGLPHPGEHLRLHPLLHNKHTKTKKNEEMLRNVWDNFKWFNIQTIRVPEGEEEEEEIENLFE